jgi:hypothetical protein
VDSKPFQASPIRHEPLEADSASVFWKFAGVIPKIGFPLGHGTEVASEPDIFNPVFSDHRHGGVFVKPTEYCRLLDPYSLEVGTSEVSVLEVSIPKVSILEVSILEVGTPKVST